MGPAVIAITVRDLSEADVAAAAAMEAAERDHPWTIRVFRDEMAAENRIYLAAVDQALAGFGGLMLVGDEAHVTNLLVRPDRRRQGVGTMLMLALLERAIDAGARHLTLEVRAANQGARELYDRFGLSPVGVRKGYYGDEDALILWVHDIDGDDYRARIETMR